MQTLLTRQEAAARVRVGVRTFDALLATAKGPTIVRIGRRVFVAEGDLDRWLAQQRQPASRKGRAA
jgi:hypothetical protein